MPSYRSRFELWAQVAGLCATAWIVWAFSVAPYWGSRTSLVFRIAQGVEIAICALGWSAVIGLTLLLVNRLEPVTMRISAAVWFAPATILLLQFSPSGLAAGLLLVVSAARLLCEPSRDAVAADPLSRHFVPTLLVSAGFQAAAVSFLIGHPLLAAGLLSMSAATLTTVAIGLGAWIEDRPPNLPRSLLGLGLTVLLALIVGQRTGGSGWGLGSGSESGLDLHSGRSAQAGKTEAAPQPAPNAAGSKQLPDRPEARLIPGVDAPGNYWGVILWPEIKPVTLLIAPLPAGGAGFAARSHPLTIPFGGEYWMFRWPFRRPPRNSFFQRGTPAALFFSTTDRAPLQMEARQKLERNISLRCCNRLQLAILNADRHPRTVSLEVILIDGDLPNAAQQSLGIATVTSVPDLNMDRPSPVPETLDFPFPSSPQLEQFNEIRVIFHREPGRRDKSARVSIERFVLVPLG